MPRTFLQKGAGFDTIGSMNENKKVLLSAVVIGFLGLGASVFFIWKDFSVGPVRSPAPLAPAAPALPELTSNGVKAPDLDGPASPPSLGGPINVTVDLPAITIEQAKETITKLTAALKKNSDLFGDWVELGLYRRLIGDYGGAAAAWEYAGAIRPKNSVSFNNLGDLYTYQIKDKARAEKNYLMALANDSASIAAYEKLYELYRYIFKDDEKAKGVLKEGISKNPDFSQRLQYLLDNY